MPTADNLAAARFRANPRYAFVTFEDLSEAEKTCFEELRQSGDAYGLLRPDTDSGLTWKSVCHDTAELYLALRQPGALPASLLNRFGTEQRQAVSELVLDRILELEHEGHFVSGIDAYPLLYQQELPTPGEGKIARLSTEALQYAQSLFLDDPLRLSVRLYFYNAWPVSPFWKHRFPTEEAIDAYLGLDSHHGVRKTLDRSWRRVRMKPPQDGWRMWNACSEPRTSEGGPSYKLYISPSCEFLRETFQAVAAVLAETRAHTFKVGGKDVANILRSDKIVAYFSTLDDLLTAADGLQRRLSGCPAHGVPFSAALDEEGLLSWGMDPPAGPRLPLWNERQSWRLWVTNRLAVALLAARSRPSAMLQPWQFALQRLGMEGVDIRTWTPDPSLWQGD